MEDQANSVSETNINFSGKIHLIVNDHQLASVATELLAVTAFGFDTETRPSFKKGDVYKVALIQIATETDAYLIRTHFVSQFDILRTIFEDSSVVKVGVAIQHDLKQLKKIFPFAPQNFIELQTIAKEKGLKNFGLKGMTEEVMQAKLSKGPKLTNWEAAVLSERQLNYAATDAWIGLRLYQELTRPISSPSSSD